MAAEQDQVQRLREELERSEQEVARIPVLEHEVQHLRRRLEVMEAEHERQLRDERGLHEVEIAKLREELNRADRSLRDIQSSPSWRVTRPLRVLKRGVS